MSDLIEVIPFVYKSDFFDVNGKLIEKKGTVVVSHGFNHTTQTNVILPEEYFFEFVNEHCYKIDNNYYLK